MHLNASAFGATGESLLAMEDDFRRSAPASAEGGGAQNRSTGAPPPRGTPGRKPTCTAITRISRPVPDQCRAAHYIARPRQMQCTRSARIRTGIVFAQSLASLAGSRHTGRAIAKEDDAIAWRRILMRILRPCSRQRPLESEGQCLGIHRKYPIEHRLEVSPVAVLACSSGSSLTKYHPRAVPLWVRALSIDASGKIDKSCYRAEGADRAQR
ncbi:hypothetical protein ACVWXN_006730 [Bradyrhizobium sp. i1.4.4]